MFGAVKAGAGCEEPALQLKSFVETALGADDDGQVAGGAERVAVFGAEGSGEDAQGLALQRLGLRVVALAVGAETQQQEAATVLGMFRGQTAPAELHGAIGELDEPAGAAE